MRLTGSSAAAVVLAASGCAKAPAAIASRCSTDPQCGPAEACVATVCLPRGTGEQSWAIELVPPTASLLGRTEQTGVLFGVPPANLTADDIEPVSGQVGGTLFARVIASLPSSIPGRPDLQLEADASADASGMTRFDLNVPGSLLGRPARFQVRPLPPSDRDLPPIEASLDLDAAVSIDLPSPDRLARLDGAVTDALGAPLPAGAPLVVRALRQDRPISTTAEPDPGGRFSTVMTDSGAAGGKLDGVVVEVFPADPAAPWPRLRTDPPREVSEGGAATLAGIRMPPFESPAKLGVSIRGRDIAALASIEPIAGALVRFETELPDAVGARATYLREGRTDSQGYAALPLVPGTAAAARRYAVTVIAPAESRFASRCLPRFEVASLPADGPEPARDIELAPRVTLQGRLTRADQSPAAGVTVTAAQIAAAPGGSCGEALTEPPCSALSDQDGGYLLRLDPGRYRLDYEPPTGAPFPRMTEDDVGVLTDGLRDVRLPAGAVAEGLVSGPDGAPVPEVEVGVYTVECAAPCDPTAARAVLRGRSTADSGGRFRVVLPVLQTGAGAD